MTKEYQKEYYEKNKERLREYRRLYALNNKKQIAEQSKEYRKINYVKLSKKCKKYYENNKEESKLQSRLYYKKNKERIDNQAKIYNQTHKEQISQQQKNWRLSHKKHIRDRTKLKYDSDINYKIKLLLRTRINLALKQNFKHGKTLEILGCTVIELKQHLESQFQEGMSWNNHSLKGWHIDHILPCASFDLSKESEQRECFHYTNLQPLWWKDNLKKYTNIKPRKRNE